MIGKKIFVFSGRHHLSFAILILCHSLNYYLLAPNPTSYMFLFDSGGWSLSNFIFALPMGSLLCSANSDN